MTTAPAGEGHLLRHSGHHRPPPGQPSSGRQRPIRSTLTVLLAIPVIAMIALWGYAAATTIGPYLASRNGQTDYRQIGASSQTLLLQLTEERATTLAWQSAHGLIPRTAMQAQRAKTDAAISAVRTGLTGTKGVGGPSAAAAMVALEQKFGQLGVIRAEIDAGQLAPLAAFAAYNGMVDTYFQFIRTQLVSDTSVPLYQQGEAVVASGQALEMMGREAAVVGGALAGGGRMTTAEYRQFLQALDNQRFLMQTINAPQSWQLAPDTFAPFYASPAYHRFSALEDQIASRGAGARLPVTPAAWQGEIESTLGTYEHYELAATTSVTHSAARVGHGILLRLILVGGAGLAAVLVVVWLLIRFGNRITGELTRFNGAVRALAEERLPGLVRRLSEGEDVDVAAEAPPLALNTRTLEVARIADGFTAVQHTAVATAVGQASLRRGVSNIFRSLARRSQSLLQRQLRMLEEMEQGTEDPDMLAQLFRLDHLTTRMRRQSEGLIILSGAAPGRRWNKPVPVIEVLRGATGEVEDYVRVDLMAETDDLVAGAAVADLTHLLAELIENATMYSPPSTRVQVKTGWGASGFIVEIEDRGLGIPAAAMEELNQRLATPPEFDLADSDQLGLLVVGRLAQRHGIRVTLRKSPFGGAAAIVLIPKTLVVRADSLPRAELTPGPGPSPFPEPVVPWQPIPAVDPPLPAGPRPYAMTSDDSDHQGLPRRTRQASLAPQLRDAPPAKPGIQVAAQARRAPLTPRPPDTAASAGGPVGRSAEQVRSLMSSVQRGWRSGRAAERSADQATGDPAAGRYPPRPEEH
ncbi:MAG TPA: nitrate- and nitrite sensing domain-containing protein [Streptosporangiaceae bacterium]